LVYAKAKDFTGLWDKYREHFEDFETTTTQLLNAGNNIKHGITKSANMTVLHIFVNFDAKQSIKP
jgi:hypothetical protein